MATIAARGEVSMVSLFGDGGDVGIVGVLQLAFRRAGDEIARGLDTALRDRAFRERAARGASPYGDGHASEAIVAVLRETLVGPLLIQKQFAD